MDLTTEMAEHVAADHARHNGCAMPPAASVDFDPLLRAYLTTLRDEAVPFAISVSTRARGHALARGTHGSGGILVTAIDRRRETAYLVLPVAPSTASANGIDLYGYLI
jgi:hypothetical protein